MAIESETSHGREWLQCCWWKFYRHLAVSRGGGRWYKLMTGKRSNALEYVSAQLIRCWSEVYASFFGIFWGLQNCFTILSSMFLLCIPGLLWFSVLFFYLFWLVFIWLVFIWKCTYYLPIRNIVFSAIVIFQFRFQPEFRNRIFSRKNKFFLYH